MDQKPIHRIDLERVGSTGILVSKWYSGWKQDGSTPCDIEDLVEGSIPALLAEYEKAGFVVWMANGSQGRALRGAITRVDILNDGNAWNMRKYCYGWSAKTPPIESKVVDAKQLEAALEWFHLKEWAVLEWDGGYRAFKGDPMPVRDRAAIQALRRKFNDEHVHYSYNLALYF